MSEWINVEDRLPENEDMVLTAFKCTYIYNACIYRDMVFECMQSGDNVVDDVTHWQPLPEPPKAG